jgi:ADP-heptose:LPS heptosyltransferase
MSGHLQKTSGNHAEIGTVFEKDEALPDFDVQAPLMSLPHILGTTLETIPNGVPYIRPPEDGTVPGQVLSEEKKLKVGLVWAGNPKHMDDRNRSIPLEKFGFILDTKGVRFFSLQVGEQTEEIRRLGYQDQLEDLTGTLTPFSATAAIMAHLDLIISVDTAPAHLAGAMGRAVWTLVTFAPDWRWMLDRSDSPWYPTMKIFRQKKIGDWDGVLAEVKENLDHMLL